MSDKAAIWMPLYIGDYLADTAHLTALESGAYLHLLMHSWRTGSLPSDMEHLRRIAKVDKDAWSNAWGMLQAFFKHDASNAPYSERLESERAEWNSKKKKAQEKAGKAAKKRWNDAPSNASSNQQAMLEKCPSPSPASSITPPTPPYRGGAYSKPKPNDGWMSGQSSGEKMDSDFIAEVRRKEREGRAEFQQKVGRA